MRALLSLSGLARAREANDDRLTAKAAAGALALSLLSSGLALALATAIAGILHALGVSLR